MEWITLEHTDGHRSSLAVFPDHLRVTGVLPHCAKIRPASAEDAAALHRWTGRRLPMPDGWCEKLDGAQTIQTHDGTRWVGVNDRGNVFINDDGEGIKPPNSVRSAVVVRADVASAIAYVVARWGA